MLKAAGPHIGFPFDHVISVEEAGYFKPHARAVFNQAAPAGSGSISGTKFLDINANGVLDGIDRPFVRRLGERRGRVMFVEIFIIEKQLR